MNNTRIGLVRCEHCGRQFNPHSGARHIPWCAKQQKESQKHRLSQEKRQALERYKWRISYKPSNQIANQQRQHHELQHISNRFKKSSINSSATLSSASAGSTSSSASVTSAGQAREGGRASNNGKFNASQPIKRSISSLTLTKQAGVLARDNKWSAGGARAGGSGVSAAAKPANQGQRGESESASASDFERLRARTKSVNDLSNMSGLVETLAKRMEEIYAQNKTLLARMSLTASGQAGASSVSSDELLAGERTTPIQCHHCRSIQLEEANYCHRCGCKVRTTNTTTTTTSNTSTTSDSPSPH